MNARLAEFRRCCLLPIVALGLISCGPATIHQDVRVTYPLPDGVVLDSLALLPVTAGEGLEGFRRTTAQLLEDEFQRQRPGLHVISASESLARLNQAGLAEEYSRMVEDYERTGILDRDRLERMAETVGTSHLMQVKVMARGDKDISMFVHIWSGERGDVVWEAVGGARTEETPYTTPRSHEEVFHAAVEALVARVP